MFYMKKIHYKRNQGVCLEAAPSCEKKRISSHFSWRCAQCPRLSSQHVRRASLYRKIHRPMFLPSLIHSYKLGNRFFFPIEHEFSVDLGAFQQKEGNPALIFYFCLALPDFSQGGCYTLHGPIRPWSSTLASWGSYFTAPSAAMQRGMCIFLWIQTQDIAEGDHPAPAGDQYTEGRVGIYALTIYASKLIPNTWPAAPLASRKPVT